MASYNSWAGFLPPILPCPLAYTIWEIIMNELEQLDNKITAVSNKLEEILREQIKTLLEMVAIYKNLIEIYEVDLGEREPENKEVVYQ